MWALAHRPFTRSFLIIQIVAGFKAPIYRDHRVGAGPDLGLCCAPTNPRWSCLGRRLVDAALAKGRAGQDACT